jgi:hypothetical protein
MVFCDHCGKQIADAKSGNYEWQTDNQGQVKDGVIYFTHKHCCLPFEDAHGGRPSFMCNELSIFPLFLGNNLALDWKKARENMLLLARI